MAVRICSIIFSIIVLHNLMVFGCARTEQCPVSVSITTVIDEVLDFLYIELDPRMTFYKEVLGFTDGQIQHFTDDAIEFFNETYGLDFSAPPDENNERFFENARMRPSFFRESVNYRVVSSNWILNGNTRSICNEVRTGSLGVTFLGDQLLRGTYGGEDGIAAGPGDVVTYGHFIMFSCAQSPVVIQYQSATPIRQEPIDGLRAVNFETYNNVLGHGKALGYDRETILPDGRFHRDIRLVFTFPHD